MAKERMVTRTIIVTKGKVLGLNVATKKAETVDFKLNGEYNEHKALVQLKKEYEGKDFQPVSIVEINKNEILFGMSEKDFIDAAKELPPRKEYAKE